MPIMQDDHFSNLYRCLRPGRPVAVQRRRRPDKYALLEAIAEAYGIDVRGGHGARRYRSTWTRVHGGPRCGVAGYGEQPSWEVSHGESYLQAIRGRFTGPGLYLLDEAEGPLSFKSTLALLYQLQDLAGRMRHRTRRGLLVSQIL